MVFLLSFRCFDLFLVRLCHGLEWNLRESMIEQSCKPFFFVARVQNPDSRLQRRNECHLMLYLHKRLWLSACSTPTPRSEPRTKKNFFFSAPSTTPNDCVYSIEQNKRKFRHGELNPGLLGPSCSFERYESEKS